MAIQRSPDISCSRIGIGKMAPICSGETGLPSGASGGTGGMGMSATTLYQWVGMSSGSRLMRSGVMFFSP